jgi:hypothetical protein
MPGWLIRCSASYLILQMVRTQKGSTMAYLTRWTVLAGVTCVLLTGCGGVRPTVPPGEPGPGCSVDHPPQGAYQSLVTFTRCMLQHHVQMPGPTRWSGHDRLSIYYPPHNSSTNAAYAACDHFKAQAKQQGGPH